MGDFFQAVILFCYKFMPSGVYTRTKENQKNRITALKGRVFTEEHKKKLSDAKIKNPVKNWLGKKRDGSEFKNWKGENVSYFGLHAWVKRKKGKARKCIHCGAENNCIQWANIDHKYKRNLDDFISLCIRCHRRYDIDVLNISIGFNQHKKRYIGGNSKLYQEKLIERYKLIKNINK